MRFMDKVNIMILRCYNRINDPYGGKGIKFMKRPNILFFFSDQQRFDTLGVNGQLFDMTPNLDELASEGVNFEHAYTPQPVCGPARSCLQSGLFATETRCFINGISLPEEQVTIAKLLREVGYETAYIGKWHLASDETHDYQTIAVPKQRRGGYLDYWMAADVLEFTSDGYSGFVFDKDGNKVEFEKYRVDAMTDYVIDYLNHRDQEKPFFLFASYLEPHHQNNHGVFEGPVGSGEKFADFIKPNDLGEGCGDWETQMPDYLGCCHSLDHNVGRIVEVLKQQGIYEDTVIIYTSDHGCHFKTMTKYLSPLGIDDYKRSPDENAIHIPLIIRGPGFLGGKKEEKLVSLIDLPTTILKLADVEADFMQGRDLQTIFTDDEWENEVYIQISESMVGRVLRTKRYKYVIHAPQKHPLQDDGSDIYEEGWLYDLEKDPLEQHNLIHDLAYKEIKEALHQKIMEHGKRAKEEFRIRVSK